MKQILFVLIAILSISCRSRFYKFEPGKWKTSKKAKKLVYCAKEGDVRCVASLLKKKVSVNSRDENGDTALMMAVSRNQLQGWKYPLASAPPGPGRIENGFKYIVEKKYGNHEKIAAMLLKRKPDLNLQNTYGDTALIKAVTNDRLKMVKKLLAKKAKIEIRNIYGETALIRACMVDSLGSVKILLAGGADINAQNYHGYTPLMKAVSTKDLSLVEYLIAKGADINIQNENDETALIQAVYRNAPQIVKLLLKNKADKSVKNYKDKTAIQAARDKKYWSIVRMLK